MDYMYCLPPTCAFFLLSFVSALLVQAIAGKVMPTVHNLTLGAFNEYGENDRYALALYGLEMVVEPYRETTIRVKSSTAPQSPTTQFRWLLIRADISGAPMDPVQVVVNSTGKDAHMNVQLQKPNELYNLAVLQMDGGVVVAEGAATVSCKYVRRELRTLTEQDREEYFDALQEFYTLAPEDGTGKYGKSFTNYARITAYHASLVSVVFE